MKEQGVPPSALLALELVYAAASQYGTVSVAPEFLPESAASVVVEIVAPG